MGISLWWPIVTQCAVMLLDVVTRPVSIAFLALSLNASSVETFIVKNVLVMVLFVNLVRFCLIKNLFSFPLSSL